MLATPAFICKKSQSLNPPVRPVCPEAPVWPVEPLAPASIHSPSDCVTCLLSSAESTENLPCGIHLNRTPESEPTCETRLPRSPGLACGAAGPCKQSQCPHIVSHAFSSLCKALRVCHACMHHESSEPLNPPVRPVCPEAPVSPVEPLAPASSHIGRHCVTCLLLSVESTEALPCAYISIECQSLTHL